jgi:uncharacterized ferritin-like protein (DUF455 family)
VKRFIEPGELARDSRFVRQDNVASTMLSTLPDDVDTVVEAFERLDPIIEVSVRGTEAEPLYEEYGPGFGLVTLNEPLDPSKHGDAASKRLMLRMHGIFVGELQALEGAGRSLWDFPDAPWEFKMNMARQCWDETRHVQIYEKLLEHVGGYAGMFPESTFLFECGCADDPALRVAGVNRALEGLACDVFRDMIRYADAVGDDTMKQAIDYVLADELTHVRFGSDWVKQFTAGDADRARAARDFQRETDRRFAFGGGRSVAKEERLEAGFSEEELAELDAILADGPSRATLIAAAELVRDRHQARLRGESVPELDESRNRP